MKTAIILHGMPSEKEYFNPERPAQSNHHWLPWIQKQLLMNGVLAQSLELPEPYDPDYDKWKAVFEQLNVDEETILIGHSCGAGFLVRWLGEHDIKVHKVALVAPWIDPDHNYAPKMFDSWEPEDIKGKADRIRLFISLDDGKEMLDTTEELKQVIRGLEIQEFQDRGHFTFGSMKTEKFSELAEFLLE